MNKLFILAALALSTTAFRYECPVTDIEPDANCQLDLTIAVDYSTSMKTKDNVYQLVNYTLSSIVPRFNVSYNNVNIALQSMGTWIPIKTAYFNNKKFFCQSAVAGENAIRYGNTRANLRNVFNTYIYFNRFPFHHRPSTKKVLVILTAVNDKKSIYSSILSSKIVRKNARVIIVGINQNDDNLLKKISDSTIFTNFNQYGQQISDFVVENTCGLPSTPESTTTKQSLITTFEPTTKITENPATENPSTENPDTDVPVMETTSVMHETTTSINFKNPISNKPGSKCSDSVTSAWLDVVFVIDTSSSMRKVDLTRLGGSIAGLFSQFTIDADVAQSTRVGYVTYSSKVDIVDDLNAFANWNDLYKGFVKLGDYREDGTELNIANALKVGQKLLQEQKSHRIPALVIVGAASNGKYVNDEAIKTADEIQNSGIKIISLTFQNSDDNLDAFGKLASESEYALISSDPNLYSKFTSAFAEINCACPLATFQFKDNNVAYADCVQGFHGQTPPNIAKLMCDLSDGILVDLTTKAKLDFLSSAVVPSEIFDASSYTIGLFHTDEDNWSWEYYNKTIVPLGNFKNWINGEPDVSGNSCASALKDDGQWYFSPNTCDHTAAKPYICQTKACDSTHLCDVGAGFKALQRHEKMLNILKTTRGTVNIETLKNMFEN